jgi:YebC/PmpR family DNA-binding regulatory protein
MSGHSHWATNKRKKGASDAKRGQLFTRLAREISMAAREGGGDADTNFRLRIAFDKARAVNMPKESIERAIKRGTGEDKSGVVIEKITYEGYASHGVALMIDCLTENRNRTIAELRHTLSRSGGSMAEMGSVAWQFDRVAYFALPAAGVNYDKVFELAVEGGANDVKQDAEYIEIFAPVEVFKSLSDRLKKESIEIEEQDLRMIAKQEMSLSLDDTLKVMRMVEEVEDLEDVESVYYNLQVSDEAWAAMETE